MVNDLSKNLYGEYDPYSSYNLQGGLMSNGGQSLLETILSDTDINGGDTVTPQRDYNHETFGLPGNKGGKLAEKRALDNLGSFKNISSLAKTAYTGQVNPSDLMAAVPNAAYASAGVEKPSGATGWISSKVPSVIGGLALGPVGAMAGGLMGTPFSDMVADTFDIRDNEQMRDDLEDTYGQITGRRGYADIKDSIKDKSMMQAPSLEESVDYAKAALNVVDPADRADAWGDFSTLRSAQNRAQEIKGLMSSHLEEKKKPSKGFSSNKGGFASNNGGERGGHTGNHSGVSGGKGGGRGGFGR